MSEGVVGSALETFLLAKAALVGMKVVIPAAESSSAVRFEASVRVVQVV